MLREITITPTIRVLFVFCAAYPVKINAFFHSISNEQMLTVYF